MLGITFWPAQVPHADMPVNWAVHDMDPSAGDDSNDYFIYEQLLLIASGIQMAGPDLTPYTFQHGLQAAHFPNPYSQEMEGAAGFGGASHSMTTDAALMWWSDTTPGPNSTSSGDVGAWCYIDAGRRFSPAAWPRGQLPFFRGQCWNSPMGPAL